MNIYTAPEAINIVNHHPQQSVEPPDDNIYKHNQPQYAKKPAKRSYLYEKLKSIFIAQRNSPTEHQSDGNPFYKSWLSFKKGLPSNEDKSGEYDQFLTNFQDVTIPIGIRTPSIRVNVREDPTAAWAAAAAFLSAASFLAMVVEMSSLDCEHVDMRGRARPIFPVGAGPCGNVGPKAMENVASPRTLFANVVAQ